MRNAQADIPLGRLTFFVVTKGQGLSLPAVQCYNVDRTDANTHAPTERYAFSPMVRAILRLHSAGESAASTPTDILRYRRSLCGFVLASCRTEKALPYVTTKPRNT